MRDAEIRGEKTPIPKKQAVSTPRTTVHVPYVRPKYEREEVELTHPLARQSTPEKNIPPVKAKPVFAPKAHSPTRKKIIFACIALAVLGGIGIGSYRILSAKKDEQTKKTSQSANADTYTIPFYTPKTLPKGYTFNNDIQSLKKDVYYYSINGPEDTVFHITQQPIPESFDFASFNKKFLNPDRFTTEAGSAIVGPVGSAIIGSVQTIKNSWIIVNCENSSAQSKVQTVIRSLKL